MVDSYYGLDEETIQLILEKEEGKYLEILDYIVKFEKRLQEYINTLSRNSNLNLIIGLLITLLGIALLIYFIFKEQKPNETELMFHYISRFSIVIMIEIFALFFLKLYKSNLSEIKYFHNEISNINSKIIALKTALLVDDKVSIKAVISELSKTERNHILKKGESTIELEKIKIDKEDSKEIINVLTNLLKINDKK